MCLRIVKMSGVVRPVIPALGRQRQVNLYEFEADQPGLQSESQTVRAM